MAPQTPLAADRQRLSLDLAPAVTLLLDHIAAVTGATKSQIVLGALLDALPDLVERADALKKRQVELTPRPQGGKR